MPVPTETDVITEKRSYPNPHPVMRPPPNTVTPVIQQPLLRHLNGLRLGRGPVPQTLLPPGTLDPQFFPTKGSSTHSLGQHQEEDSEAVCNPDPPQPLQDKVGSGSHCSGLPEGEELGD